MKQQLEQYNTLRKQTLNKLDKTYKQLNDPELTEQINLIHLEASKETQQIILELTKATEVSDEAKEYIEDLKELLNGELEFVFEDSEFTFNDLSTTINK